MTRKAEIVIIGAGVMGLSAAYHLAKMGCKDVLVLEKEELPGMGATGRNAGGIRHQFSTSVNVELSKASIQMLLDFEEELGQKIDLNLCGYLFLIDNPCDLAAFQRNVAMQNSLGVQSQLLDTREIERRLPLFQLDDIVGGTFFEGDGLVDPGGVVQGYFSQSKLLGVEIEFNTRVTQIQIEKDRVAGVGTNLGDVSCSKVLIAAGPWSGGIGKMINIDLPVAPVRRQVAVTGPIPGMTRDFPFVIDFRNSLYFHYEGGGILTGMSNPSEEPGFLPGVDPEWRDIHLEAAIERFPALADATLVNEWAGYYEVTPDNQPIIGKLPHLEGLYSCTGFSGHGFMHGPICGKLIAEEILEGKARTIDISSLSWRTFESSEFSGEYNVI